MLISDLNSSFVSLQNEWGGVLFNPKWYREEMSITWKDADRYKYSFFMTDEDIQECLRNDYYSFQLFDGSLLQLLYKCNSTGEALIEASLSYLRSNNDICEIEIFDEEELSLEDIEMSGVFSEDCVEQVSKDRALYNSWIRIDYAPKNSKGVVHSAAHFHANLFSDLRIPLKGVPTPKQFVEAIIAWFYPDKYKETLLNDDGSYNNSDRIQKMNQSNIDSDGHESASKILHFSMPD